VPFQKQTSEIEGETQNKEGPTLQTSEMEGDTQNKEGPTLQIHASVGRSDVSYPTLPQFFKHTHIFFPIFYILFFPVGYIIIIFFLELYYICIFSTIHHMLFFLAAAITNHEGTCIHNKEHALL